MTETTLAVLRQLFIDSYDDLKARLTQRLGSADLAGDALQDTWLRLARTQTMGAVHSPGSYLYRIVLNAARDRKRTEKRYLTSTEVDALLHLADDAPGPAQISEGRAHLQALASVLAEMPPRRCAILLMARVDNMARQDIADKLGISLRLVSKELHLAHEYCMAHRDRIEG